MSIADKAARSQTVPAQAREEPRSAQGVGAAGAVTGLAAEGQNGRDSVGQGAGQGTGQGAGGVPGGVAGSSGSGAGGGKVDCLPRIIEKVKPAYPEHARRMHKTGVVTLKFLVDAEGCVHQASVVEASPPGLFEESALSAISRWRFAPAMRQGRLVPTWLILPVRFTLER